MTTPADAEFSVIPVESDRPGVTITAGVVGGSISKADADKLRKLAQAWVDERMQDPGNA